VPETKKEIFELYGGQVRMEYTDSSHRYRVSEEGSKFESRGSVTTVLNVLNKAAIKPWAIKITCNYIEDNLRQLLAGNSFSIDAVFKIITEARTAAERAREDAAEVGTNTHDWLRDYWKGYVSGVCPPMPKEERTVKCVNAALNWFDEHRIEPIAVEEPQYSRLHKICGRPDLIARVDGELAVVDYKSTKFLYPEVALQMCPYAKMHEEMHGQFPSVRWGLRLDKTTGDFEDRRYPPDEFDLDWDSFKCCLTLYERLKHLRRVEKKDFLEGI
jgi:hypothetical protein